MTTATDHPEPPAFWTLSDVALFIGSILPIYLIASLITAGGASLAPKAFESAGIRMLVFQTAFYALILSSLYLVIRTRYDQPLWRSLGWTLAFRGAWICLLCGPILAVGIGILDNEVLHAPDLPSPVDVLVNGHVAVPIVVLFSAVAGPVIEELIFRGFLQMLFERLLGPIAGIVCAALPFALIHGPQDEWSWKYLLPLFLAGCVFGVARRLTGSTAAPALMHLGYNGTLVIAYVAGLAT